MLNPIITHVRCDHVPSSNESNDAVLIFNTRAGCIFGILKVFDLFWIHQFSAHHMLQSWVESSSEIVSFKSTCAVHSLIGMDALCCFLGNDIKIGLLYEQSTNFFGEFAESVETERVKQCTSKMFLRKQDQKFRKCSWERFDSNRHANTQKCSH